MEISVNQVHNVLRTYRHMFKENSHRADRNGGKDADQEQSHPSTYDPVSLSPESIKRLEEAENKYREMPLPPEK